jgi:microcystin-dependent protein
MKNPVIFSLAILLFLQVESAYAQVGINNPTPDSSSVLDLKHDARGLLIPRMDDFRRNSINKPAHGLMVYDTFYDMLFYFTGTNKVNTANNWMGLSPWRFRDTINVSQRHAFLDNNVVNVGIGTSSPKSKLTLMGNMSIGKDTIGPANGLRVEGDIKANSSVKVKDTVSASVVAGYGTVPVGGIIMWSGSTTAVPDGWALCNGQTINGITTPNLSGRFIVGVGTATGTGAGPTNYTSGATGGEETHTLAVSEMPAHSHGGTTSTDGNHTHDYSRPNGGEGYVAAFNSSDEVFKWNQFGTYTSTTSGNHAHTISSDGGGAAHENRPPYFALAYIIRIK